MVTKTCIASFGAGITPGAKGRTKSLTFVDIAGKLVSRIYEVRRGNAGAASTHIIPGVPFAKANWQPRESVLSSDGNP